MRLLTLILSLMLVSSCAHMSFGDPVAAVAKDPVKTLAYETHELSSAYHELIKTPGNIAQIKEAFTAATDDYVRFSYTVVIYEKSVQMLSDEDVKAAQEFFQAALDDKFDWIKQTAVWGLSRVGTMNDFASLINIMEEGEGWLEDDVHAALTLIRDRSNGRTPASENADLNFHDTAYWKKWWSKNSKRY